MLNILNIKLKFNSIFHLVKVSPWPLFISICLWFFLLNFVDVMYEHNVDLDVDNIFFAFMIIIIIIILWFGDIVKESKYELNKHTYKVNYGLIIGFILFITSEIFLFGAFFWFFFHNSLIPSTVIYNEWQPYDNIIIESAEINIIITISEDLSILLKNYNVTFLPLYVTFLPLHIIFKSHLFTLYNILFLKVFFISNIYYFNNIIILTKIIVEIIFSTFCYLDTIFSVGFRISNFYFIYLAINFTFIRIFLFDCLYFNVFINIFDLKNEIYLLFTCYLKIFSLISVYLSLISVYAYKLSLIILDFLDLIGYYSFIYIFIVLFKIILNINVPLYNTLILLSSAVFLTGAHNHVIFINYFEKVKNINHRKYAILYLVFTINLGFYFLYNQIVVEYINTLFYFSDNVYSTAFFALTGLHIIHVIIGFIFLFVCFIRFYKYNNFNYNKHIGFMASIWYWHFVDVVWIFLYFNLYIWTS